MDTERNGDSINLTFGIAGSQYDPDLEPNSFGQGLFEGSTWPIVGVNKDEILFSPELGPIIHTNSVPDIFVNGNFSLDSIGWSDSSPVSFTENGYFESPVREQPNGASWDIASLNSESVYQMQRSLSFAGTTDTAMGDGWSEQMMVSPSHLHPHSLPTNFEVPFYDPAHKAESVSSTESFGEIPADPMLMEMVPDASNPPELTIYEMAPSATTGAMVANATKGGRKPIGRHGHLKPHQREAAARMRKVGACAKCRERKAKCDGNIHTIYCSACIKYYRGKGTIPPVPCRGSGRVFESLAEVIMEGHVFPKKRPLALYLGNEFDVGNTVYQIHLNLGFGAPFKVEIKLVTPKDKDKLVHRHIKYPWQPNPMKPTKKLSSRDFVFPAILADTQNLPAALEGHISELLDNQANFRQFPLYRSELAVLQQIYIYYQSLPQVDFQETTRLSGRITLRQALKLLILVHIGGDTELDVTCRCRPHNIVAQYFPEIQDSEPVVATPCFIRGQLGPIFAQLARKLMKDVLSRLEILSFSRDNCQHFPIILSTFAVLFMTVETIQYHAAKESYHASYDSEAARALDKTHVDANEQEGVENLLNFYNACFGNCHANLHNHNQTTYSKFAAAAARTNVGGGEADRERTVAYLQTIKDAVDRARRYLVRKKDGGILGEGLGKGDMSVYFDRLLAKLFLLRGEEMNLKSQGL